jgi:RNA polymerase sigma-54 factor
MIQAMQILQLPSLDLQERIEQELLENPLLERVEGHHANGAGDEPDPTAEASRQEALDAVLAMRERDRWDSNLRERRGSFEDSERKHQAMQNSPDCYHSLGESLLSQLALIELDGRQHQWTREATCHVPSRCSLRSPRSRAPPKKNSPSCWRRYVMPRTRL